MVLRGKRMGALYTTHHVMNLLHIPHSSLYQMVKDGRLHPVHPKSTKRGMLFPCEEIDALMQAIQAQDDTRQLLTFEILTEIDMAQVAALSTEWFGPNHHLRFSTLRAWWRKNPSMFIGVRNRNGFLWGFTAIVPLSQRLIEQICRNERRFQDVTVDELLRYSPQQETTCYIPFFCIDEQRRYADRLRSILVCEVMERYFCELGRMGVPMTRVYYRALSQNHAGTITAELVHLHGFQRIDAASGHSAATPGDDAISMMVSFTQADSALVSAYYAGKRERSEAPAVIGATAHMDFALYYVPGEGIYGPVIDGHYVDRATDKLVAIVAEPFPGQKRRGRPPKQRPVQVG